MLAEAAEDDVYLSASHLFEVIFQLGRLGQADMMAEVTDPAISCSEEIWIKNTSKMHVTK